MKLAAVVITGLIIFAGIFDLVLVVVGYARGKNISYSVSRFMQLVGMRSPAFCVATGFVMGHFWGYMPCPECPAPVPSASQIEPIPELDESRLSDPIPVRPRGAP